MHSGKWDTETMLPVYRVIFDGHCPLCRKSVALLRLLDWLERLRTLDLHQDQDEIARFAPQLTHERMMQAMQLITPHGRVYAGFYALRRMARALPALWLVLPLMYLPGMSQLGPVLYRWVARRRYGLQPCDERGSCRR